MESHSPRPGKKLADETFVAAITCGATVENAAAKAGISPRTAYRRLNDPAIQQRLVELKAEIVQRASAMLSAATLESIKTLLELQNRANGENIRLGAAKAIATLGLRFRDAVDIEQRLAALEATAKKESGGND